MIENTFLFISVNLICYTFFYLKRFTNAYTQAGKRFGKDVTFFAKVSHNEALSERCGADERGTHPLYERVSHNHPRENVF